MTTVHPFLRIPTSLLALSPRVTIFLVRKSAPLILKASNEKKNTNACTKVKHSFIIICVHVLQKLPRQGIWVRMARQMITSLTIVWTQVRRVDIHTIQAHTVLILPHQGHDLVLHHCSLSGSPSLSPNPVSPANSNLGKQNQSVKLHLQSHKSAIQKKATILSDWLTHWRNYLKLGMNTNLVSWMDWIDFGV